MAVRVKMELNLSADVIARAKVLLRGAPKEVHQHRVSVGLHEADASAQAINVGANKPNTNKAKINYRGGTTSRLVTVKLKGRRTTQLLAKLRLIEVALWHEFGTARTPERSWLRSWFDMLLDQHKAQMLAAMRAEYKGDKEAVARFAAEMRYELVSRIAQGTAGLKPLSRATRREREAAGLPGGPPLYATTQLVGSFHAHLDGRRVA